MAAPAGGTPPSSTVLLNPDTASIYPHSMIEKRLLKVLHQIEWLDIMLHREQWVMATATEFALYGLIHRHVNLYIKLSETEDIMTAVKYSTRRIGLDSTHSDNKMHISRSNMDGSSRPAEISLEVLFNKMDDNERYLKNIWGFLGKCRDYLSQSCVYPLKFAMEGIKLTDIGSEEGFETIEFPNTSNKRMTRGFKNQENELCHLEKSASTTDNEIGTDWLAGDKVIDIKLLLRRILRELLDIGRTRSYAPPSEIEIKHYRQIRIRIASSLAYAKAKTLLQPSGKSKGNKRQSVHTSRGIGKEKWVWTGYDYEYRVEYYPGSHILANMFDYLPDILLPLQECRDHASLCSSSFCKYMKGQEHKSLSRLTKQQKDFGLKVSQELEFHNLFVKDTNELSSIDNFSVEENNSTFCEAMTRAECLHEILNIFEKLKSSFTTALSVEEVRLLAQIDEHSDSSMWLSRLLKMEYPDQKVQVVYTRNGESRSREDYLNKILVLVEAIRRSCMDIPPNNSEKQLYEKLAKYVTDAFLNTNTRALIKGRKRKMDDYAPCDLDYIDDLLKDVYLWQMKWFQKVEGEFMNMLKAILPSFCRGFDHSDNGLKWISENMKSDMVPEVVNMFEKELSELPDSAQRKLKLFDEFLLMLKKAMRILYDIRVKMYKNYSRLDDLIDCNDSRLLWEEVSSVCKTVIRNKV